MRAFAPEPRATRRTTIAKPATPRGARSLPGGAVNAILDLQTAIGNQAVQRLSQALPESAHEQIRPIDTAPASVDQALAGAGRPLPAGLRQDMEQRLGHDFSHVRVHGGAMAEQSARDVNAHAYTVGHHIVFGAGRFAPQTHEGRRLIAHELAHVVQQSRSPSPGVVQRQRDPAARARVEAAMNKLKARFGLAEVGEEKGATWSESELAKVNAAFSRVSREDQPLLRGLHLIRTDKFEPSVRGGRTFTIAGRTVGTGTIKLAKGAFRGDASTILHEVGHLINNKVAAAMLGKSKAKFDLDVAREWMEEGRKKAPTRAGREVADFVAALNQVTAAASDLMYSGEDDRAAKQTALDEAELQADFARPEQLKTDSAAVAWMAYHDRQRQWVAAVEEYMRLKGTKNLTGFIEVVTKYNLARKGYTPFTDYVAAHWPAQPEEFFAQSFHTWRTNRAYLKKNMRPLFDWFEKGGHREGKGYLEGKDPIETVRETAPLIYELGREVKETFYPKDLHDVIFGD